MNIICRFMGHKLPRHITESHPAITVTMVTATGSGGQARPIACERCGHLVSPMDDQYPMIEGPRQ